MAHRLTNARRAELRERELRARVRELERLVMAMAERIAAASEVLSRIAERRKARGRD